jgi:hypothetical protein
MRRVIRVAPRQSSITTRAFTTSRHLKLREDRDRSPEEVEKAKQEQMKKQEWHRDVASQSEEHVAAEKEHVQDHDSHMEKLQKETAQKSEENHPQGKS